MMTRTTPTDILRLPANEVYVFSSDLRGMHGTLEGALAHEKFGAVRGCGFGHFGQSYAIPTRDFRFNVIPLHVVAIYIEFFVRYAEKRQDLRFLVTEIGSHEHYGPSTMWRFFKNVPANVQLPESFWFHKTKHEQEHGNPAPAPDAHRST